jgi:hypothetical protein
MNTKLDLYYLITQGQFTDKNINLVIIHLRWIFYLCRRRNNTVRRGGSMGAGSLEKEWYERKKIKLNFSFNGRNL